MARSFSVTFAITALAAALSWACSAEVDTDKPRTEEGNRPTDEGPTPPAKPTQPRTSGDAGAAVTPTRDGGFNLAGDGGFGGKCGVPLAAAAGCGACLERACCNEFKATTNALDPSKLPACLAACRDFACGQKCFEDMAAAGKAAEDALSCAQRSCSKDCTDIGSLLQGR